MTFNPEPGVASPVDDGPRLLAAYVTRARRVGSVEAERLLPALENGSPLVSRVLRKRRHAALTPGEAAVLAGAIAEIWDVEPRQTVVQARSTVDVSTLLITGLMTRYVDDRNGDRQVVAVHVAGDFVDLHAYPLRSLDHAIEALTAVRIGIVPHSALRSIQDTQPELARKLWFMTLLDGALLRRAVFRLGRLSAIQRVAGLFCELHLRLHAVGLAGPDRFPLPVTQSDLASICGITNVHVNRVLRELRDSGLVSLSAPSVVVHDLPALARLGHFDSDYLYLDPDPLVQSADRWTQGG